VNKIILGLHANSIGPILTTRGAGKETDLYLVIEHIDPFHEFNPDIRLVAERTERGNQVMMSIVFFGCGRLV
jgi:hypothetical protein